MTVDILGSLGQLKASLLILITILDDLTLYLQSEAC